MYLFKLHRFRRIDTRRRHRGDYHNCPCCNNYANIYGGNAPPAEFDRHISQIVHLGIKTDKSELMLDKQQTDGGDVAYKQAQPDKSHAHIDEYVPHTRTRQPERAEQTYRADAVEDNHKQASKRE